MFKGKMKRAIRKKKGSSPVQRKTIKKVAIKSKKSDDKLKTMSVDNFLENELENSDSELENTGEEPIRGESDEEIANDDDDESDADEAVDGDSESGDEIENHKEALEKLKQTDPEFYKFLQENDKKLLHFNVSDDEDDDDDAEEVDETEQVHKLPDELEVASDESDFEDEATQARRDQGVISLKLLKTWEKEIQKGNSNKTITELTQAFHAALRRVSSEEVDPQEPSMYKVEGSSVFNAVIQLCVIHLGPALRRFLGIMGQSKQPPHKCKKFNKVKRVLKGYFTDLLKLLGAVTSPNIQTVLLKHLHYMSPFLISFPNITKPILKRLIILWGTANEGVQVLTFFCILRITNGQKDKFLDTVLKSMYMIYVKNSKFVSLNSLASINFMKRSLVEMYALDVNVSYQHVFLYIRQLAIHLRNAITVNKKENIQTVYNWQFVNSLKLWGNLLAVSCNKQQLQQLIYPFVQICLGTIKLVPTAQYYPLRFQITQILIDLSKESGVFIPILPFLLEILNSYDFNKKHQRVSMKPLQFTCLLRASKSQMQENGFKDRIIDVIYEQMLDYLSHNSNSIAFPDLSLVCSIQIKQFNKKCSNVNYTRKFKQIVEKIEQNCQFIESERAKLTLNLTDFKQIDGWENQIRNKGTPLTTYYENWSKVHNIKKNKQLTNNEELGDYNLPTLKKRKKSGVDSNRNQDGPVELFPSDSEDSEGASTSDVKSNKRKRGSRGGKNAQNRKHKDFSGPVDDDGTQDIVQDLNLNDW